jgi:hypothetical protein
MARKRRRSKTKEQNPVRRGRRGGVVLGKEQRKDTQPKPSNHDVLLWREMRKDPTLALARAIATAPIRSAGFSVKADKDATTEMVDYVQALMNNLWTKLIYDMCFGKDYGWASFEKHIETMRGELVPGDNPNLRGVYQFITEMKPLTPETTTVVVKKSTGAYNGLRNTAPLGGGTFGQEQFTVYLDPLESFWYTQDKECDNYYGESTMERAVGAYRAGTVLSEKMAQYATKNAAPIPMIEYPEGENTNEQGVEVSNHEIASAMLANLGQSLGVAFPSVVGTYMDMLIKHGMDPEKVQAWKLKFLETNAQHGDEFLQMVRKSDVDKMRAWLVPERAALEGQFGTKAESETQGDLVLVSADLTLQVMVDCINRDLINQMLMLNFGPTSVGKVKILTERLDPIRTKLFRDIIRGIFGDPMNADLFLSEIGWEQILDIIGIPISTERSRNPLDVISDRRSDDDANRELVSQLPQELHRSHDPEEENPMGYLDGVLYEKVNGIWTPKEDE